MVSNKPTMDDGCEKKKNSHEKYLKEFFSCSHCNWLYDTRCEIQRDEKKKFRCLKMIGIKTNKREIVSFQNRFSGLCLLNVAINFRGVVSSEIPKPN